MSRCGAVVLELARPGCAPNAATVEAVTAAGARPAERWRRTAGAAAGRILEVAAPPGAGWPDAGAAPLVVAVEPEPDFGEAPVLYSQIRSQRDGWLMLLEAIRAGREPDEVEIRKLDEEEARMRVKRRPSPAGPGQGIASRRAVS